VLGNKGCDAARILLGLIFLAVIGVLAWVRLSPNDPAAWHVDPLSATRNGMGGWLVRPEGGDAMSAVYPAEALAMLDRIALDTAPTTRLAGSVAEGRITYVTRSLLMGYPDFTTIAALPVSGGITFAIHARQRFGAGDMGVNRARVENWLATLDRALAPTASNGP